MQANYQPTEQYRVDKRFSKDILEKIKDKPMMVYNPQFTKGKKYAIPKMTKDN